MAAFQFYMQSAKKKEKWGGGRRKPFCFGQKKSVGK
jgi:hypothetical protein